ncbi:hypothetical protein ONZ43_g7016 [Nemania bipapillata]|uniref:Uncharacterized protein n=1 Tax=Nemania bipapillata TaxID=110536 RepID=A0ACC2HUX6_9PEZI|nr:hypothetical protein ONZ43_g7016 [Nemania bipapillata]
MDTPEAAQGGLRLQQGIEYAEREKARRTVVCNFIGQPGPEPGMFYGRQGYVPPRTMATMTAVAEDEEGTTVLLELHHQQSSSAIDVEDTLCPNTILIVKEPFFKATGDGAYGISVDHVSDIVWLNPTDPRIPPRWRDEDCEAEASSVLRGRGNMATNNSQWATAERLYSQAVQAAKTPDEKELALLNRSLANLRLQRPEKALEDAMNASKGGRLVEKGLFREARALYELAKFTESVERWRRLVRAYPLNTDARAELRRSLERVKEEYTGRYNFVSMYEQARANPPMIDCATYKGPVAVRRVHGQDKGLFTTKAVKAGELLICEKAFAYNQNQCK